MTEYSMTELRALVPDSDVKAAYLARPDIAALPPETQAASWTRHQEDLADFWARMDGMPAVAVRKE